MQGVKLNQFVFYSRIQTRNAKYSFSLKLFFGVYICAFHCGNYRKFNNGVYRAYFSRSQEGYDAAAKDVFEALDKVRAHPAQYKIIQLILDRETKK